MAKKFQFSQTGPGKLLLKIVPDSRFERNEIGKSFLREVWDRVDKGSLEISTEYVDNIPSTSSGKTKPFIRES